MTILTQRIDAKDPSAGTPLTADELSRHPLFGGVPLKLLQRNEGAVVRRTYQKGDTLCREGEFGATAFFIEQGTVTVSIQSRLMKDSRNGDARNRSVLAVVQGLTGLLFGRNRHVHESSPKKRYIPTDATVDLPYHDPVAVLGPGELVGEGACINSYPRSATVQAAEDCTVLEMLWNMLDVLRKNKQSAAMLDEMYRLRALDSHLHNLPLLFDVANEHELTELMRFWRPRAELLRLEPHEIIFREGDPADCFYLVRLGFVKVSLSRFGAENVRKYLGRGEYFGEIGMLSSVPELRDLFPHGLRTATCTAMDHVDLVRISGNDFCAMLDAFPSIRSQIVETARRHLKENERALRHIESLPLGDFVQQGLYEAQSLLVLDLEKCTRCDECVKACADGHGGVTRMVREGMRFDKFLVATSCRSCLDPLCMIGCPTGAIRRGKTGEIVIDENSCVGCKICAKQCPYGAITMHARNHGKDDGEHTKHAVAVPPKAVACDCCANVKGEPYCVYACPHDAAHRISGQKLIELCAE